MPLAFDATLKDLVQSYPRDWLAGLGFPVTGPVSILTPDLSTLTAFTDTVLRVGDVLVHLDFQSGPDPNLPRRLLLYNVLLHDRYQLPVHSLVVLLRPRANRSDLTGEVRYEARPGHGRLDFQFEIVRLWEVPVDTLLTGGLGTLPLAPLGLLPGGAAPEEALPAVIGRLVERALAELPEPEAGRLVTGAFVLSGLRIAPDVAVPMFHGVRAMQDSSTYQYILNEGRQAGLQEGLALGRVEEAQRVLLRLGSRSWGPPDEGTEAAVRAVRDLERLERLLDQVMTANGWQELLATP
jgi:predicted transposase YdaD